MVSIEKGDPSWCCPSRLLKDLGLWQIEAEAKHQRLLARSQESSCPEMSLLYVPVEAAGPVCLPLQSSTLRSGRGGGEGEQQACGRAATFSCSSFQLRKKGLPTAHTCRGQVGRSQAVQTPGMALCECQGL